MKSLVIDTATTRTSVALFTDGILTYTGFHDGATEHAEALPRLVAEALHIEKEIDEVVVGMGPGPFTGLRVGIVFAQTFATARNIPWIGVCSLDGIAVEAADYIVSIDARRKEIYWAKYSSGARIAGPFVSSSDVISNEEVAKFGFGFTETLFPSPELLLAKARVSQVTEPIYIRRPDALPTSERR